ncbi:MAG: SDR family oxidoreductase [Candidatus Omnitrophica bacterium]|nr:SDR family oxidoreductase [Candidatus Omnitrophota bacterium]
MRVLITGGTGLLGKTLLETAPQGCEVLATHHHLPPPAAWKDRFLAMDLLDELDLFRLLTQVRPDAVIHTAGVGSVDQAERDPESVSRINVGGTQVLAELCQRLKIFLAAVSSNAIFDGDNPPYSEESARRPINRYGQLKVKAEDAVRASGCRHLIVRPILMYGWPWPGGRGNVVTRWLERLEEGKKIPVAREVMSMPLRAEDCSRAIWTALERGMTGALHVAGPQRLPLTEFALAVCRIFGFAENLVKPVAGALLHGLAPRPKDTSFVTRRMSEELEVKPMGVEEGLTSMRERRACSASVTR